MTGSIQRSLIVGIPVLATATSVLAWHFWLGRSAPATVDTESRIAAVERMLSELKRDRERDLERTHVQDPVPHIPPHVSPGESGIPDKAMMEPETGERQILDEIYAKLPAFLQARLEEEPVDQSWGPSAEARVASGLKFLERVDRGGTFHSVECRTTVCRLRGSFESIDAFNGMMKDMLTPEDQPSSAIVGPHGHVHRGSFEQSDDGSVNVEVYMFREGYNFDPRDALDE